MNKRLLLFVLLAVVLVFSVGGVSAKKQDTSKAMPNLSFPLIMTNVIQLFFQQTWVDADADNVVDASEWVLTLDPDGNPIPIAVDEVIAAEYTGTYPGNDGAVYCYYTLDADGNATDINLDGIIDDSDLTCVPMVGWLESMKPWHPQPVTTTSTDPNDIWNADFVDSANSWQADWLLTDALVTIDFIDWGNPLENINPIVGQRFPVEVALYEKLTATMTAYKMACLEYPGTKVELFGTSANPNPGPGSFTFESYFATVLTTQFTAEVYNPDGSITVIPVSPGIGPSGKMNFASSGGGWIPTMPGWHRIWLHVNDPLISFSGAIVNNDEHYIMSTGSMAQTLNANKLALTGIIGNSTYIDVYVVRPSGNKP